MASTKITLERSIEINDINFMYACTKCKILKPNSDFVYSKDNRNTKGRSYTTSCKSCRNLYSKKLRENPTESFIKSKKEQSKKNKLNTVFLSSKGNAKKRGLEHNITKDYIEELYSLQNGLCYYTDKLMHIDLRDKNNNKDCVSIDRIDSDKGYIFGNLVLCRWQVNRMKNDLSNIDFLQIISEINKKHNI